MGQFNLNSFEPGIDGADSRFINIGRDFTKAISDLYLFPLATQFGLLGFKFTLQFSIRCDLLAKYSLELHLDYMFYLWVALVLAQQLSIFFMNLRGRYVQFTAVRIALIVPKRPDLLGILRSLDSSIAR